MAHRCAEWDGWEEGLVDSILGPEEFEHEWFKVVSCISSNGNYHHHHQHQHQETQTRCAADSEPSTAAVTTTTITSKALPSMSRMVKISSKLPLLQEQEKEQMLNTTGDICGGRGGELGRRLEAWLTVNGNGNNGCVDHAESEDDEDDDGGGIGGIGTGD